MTLLFSENDVLLFTIKKKKMIYIYIYIFFKYYMCVCVYIYMVLIRANVLRGPFLKLQSLKIARHQRFLLINDD